MFTVKHAVEHNSVIGSSYNYFIGVMFVSAAT